MILSCFIAAAAQHCRDEVADITLHSQLSNANNADDKDSLEQLERWTDAASKMEGHWNFIVIKSPISNAFVTELCPRYIFIHQGLLINHKPTDDELGVVLGHELSHVILGHSSSQLDATLMSSIIQLMFLSFIDPSGLLYLLLEFFSFEANSLFKASYSRECETEADNLGLKIASKACFDVEQGSMIFQKLASIHGENSEDSVPKPRSSWYDSHPNSVDRYNNLMESIKHLKLQVTTQTIDCGKWRADLGRSLAALKLPTKAH